MERKYLNINELQRVLGIGRSTAYALMRRADFPTTHVGRKVVVEASALDAWAARGGTVMRDGERECKPVREAAR